MAIIYLDNAATSFPKPRTVARRVEKIINEIGGNPGRASHRMALNASRVIFRTRESLSRLIGAKDSSRVVFTKNATEGVNIALKGMLKAGDHVVTTAFEHNSVTKTLKALERFGVKVTMVKGSLSPDLIEPRDVLKVLTKKTKAVIMTHASNVFGTIEPVAEIGAALRKKGVLFMVDGAQTVGAMPLDVNAMNIDVLIGTGHKALLGPQGVGLLYLREGIEAPPLISGGTGEDGDNIEIPERLEAGTMNTPGIGGLGAGIEFVIKEGVRKIRRHEEELTGALLKGLSGMKKVSILGPHSAKKRAALVSFTVDGFSAAEVGTALDRRFGIMVRCGTHCAPYAHRLACTFPDGAVRVSPGYFNTGKDTAEFLRAVKIIIKA